MNHKYLNHVIYPHFYKVLSYLNWTINSDDVRVMDSNSHFLIQFSRKEKPYIYKHAKFSQDQINRQVIAFDLLKNLTAKLFYFDKYCLIVAFVEGKVLTLDSTDIVWKQLGSLLSNIHNFKGPGFGFLVSTQKTRFDNFSQIVEGYVKNLSVVDKLGILSKHDFIKLKTFVMNPPEPSDPIPRICHGDFWPKNLIQEEESGSLVLIDWEGLLSCYREYDFVHFGRADDPDAPRRLNLIKDSYNHELNQDLINYFIVTHTISRYSYFCNDKDRLEVLNKRLLNYKKYFQ